MHVCRDFIIVILSVVKGEIVCESSLKAAVLRCTIDYSSHGVVFPQEKPGGKSNQEYPVKQM
jgi:hypothetical protein